MRVCHQPSVGFASDSATTPHLAAPAEACAGTPRPPGARAWRSHSALPGHPRDSSGLQLPESLPVARRLRPLRSDERPRAPWALCLCHG